MVQAIVGYVIFFSRVDLLGTFRQHLLGFVTFQDLQRLVDVATDGCPIDPWPVSCILVDLFLIEIVGTAL